MSYKEFLNDVIWKYRFWSYGGFLSHGGTSVHHQFFSGIFHYKYHPVLGAPIYGNPHIDYHIFIIFNHSNGHRRRWVPWWLIQATGMAQKNGPSKRDGWESSRDHDCPLHPLLIIPSTIWTNRSWDIPPQDVGPLLGPVVLFFPKQCGHSHGVLTVGVKALCSIGVVSVGFGTDFTCKFPHRMALVRSPVQPSRHFGPVRSLSLWPGAHFHGQGDLVQRSWQKFSYRDLAKGALMESLYRDLFKSRAKKLL